MDANSHRPASDVDRIEGVPVIERLDVGSLPLGQRHRFWFRAGRMNTGHGWYVPVIVLRGKEDGPRLMIPNAIQGEHLNGMLLIWRLMEGTDPATLTGTLIGLPQLNIPALLHNNHNLVGSNSGGYTLDLNRAMPGDPTGGSLASRYAGRLWQGLLDGNADLVLDLHTPVSGLLYPYFVFADTRDERVRRISEALAPDLIKVDPGEPGSIETEMNRRGVPAVTVELGAPNRFEPDLIERGLRGVRAVMAAWGMIALDESGAAAAPFVGETMVPVVTQNGGIAEVHVALAAEVSEGQPVATVRDPFGRVVERATAPVSGRILAVATDPLREPGSVLVRILVGLCEAA